MMLIDGLGGHASSGENRWVEGAEWRVGGEVKLEQMSRGCMGTSESGLSDTGQRTWDQEDSEQMDVAEKAPGTLGAGCGFTVSV